MVEIEGYLVLEDLYYLTTEDAHIWAKVEDGKVRSGVDDFGQRQMGEVVYVESPSVGDKVEYNKGYGTIESGKATKDLYSPVSGTITEINSKLDDEPKLVNDDPYGEGWIVLIEPSNLDADLKNLLHGDAAVKWMREEAEKAK